MSISIKQGAVMAYYCFDIANEIHLDRVETVFGKRPIESKLEFLRVMPSYVQYKSPPFLVKLGEKTIGSRVFVAEAKIYDFGVVSIRFWLPVLGRLSSLKRLVSSISASSELEKEAVACMEKLRAELEPAIEKHKMDVEKFAEDYIVVEINRFDRQISAKGLYENYREEIGQMLRCENEKLDESQLADSTKQPLSYTPKDLVLIDWNAAFVYDPKHSYDIIDIIEYAVIQLLELRTYDSVLDIVLDKAYAELLREKGIRGLYPFSKTLKYLSTVKLEVSEIVEKVSNSIKLVGDVYLAKVYSAASSRFYLDKWRESVRDKLEILEAAYSESSHRITEKRMVVLEILIVLLFIIDLVLLAAGK